MSVCMGGGGGEGQQDMFCISRQCSKLRVHPQPAPCVHILATVCQGECH